MKNLKPKPESLSPKQSAIWDAVNTCKSSRDAISEKSGVCVSSLRLWMAGINEPLQRNFDYVIQAIEQLNTKGLDL